MSTTEERVAALTIAVRLLAIKMERQFPGTLENLKQAVPMNTLPLGQRRALEELLSGQ